MEMKTIVFIMCAFLLIITLFSSTTDSLYTREFAGKNISKMKILPESAMNLGKEGEKPTTKTRLVYQEEGFIWFVKHFAESISFWWKEIIFGNNGCSVNGPSRSQKGKCQNVKISTGRLSMRK